MNAQGKRDTRRLAWCDYTWNPVRGCLHQCQWIMSDGALVECYAKSAAERTARHAYPEGFEHHYWKPDVLAEPMKVKRPSRIFLNSMSDLMGYWIPEEQVNQIFDACRRTPWHTFFMLTKHAPRLRLFDFPPNVCVGISAPPSIMYGTPLTDFMKQRWMSFALRMLDRVDVPVRWICVEPLSFDIAPLLKGANLQWALLGAASSGGRTYQPRAEWVQNLVDVLDAQGTRIFMQSNLAWTPQRREAPLARAELSAASNSEYFISR